MGPHGDERRDRGSDSHHRHDLLIVSEDPELIHATNTICRGLGLDSIGCLGPAHAPCMLESRSTCPLADRSEVVLVDAPPCGSFTRHTKSIRAGSYVERLQDTLHRTSVILLAGGVDRDEVVMAVARACAAVSGRAGAEEGG